MTATYAVDSRVCRRCFQVMQSAAFRKFDSGEGVCSPVQECLCLGSLTPALQAAWQHAQLRPPPVGQLPCLELQHVDCIHMVHARHALGVHVDCITRSTSTKPMTILFMSKVTNVDTDISTTQMPPASIVLTALQPCNTIAAQSGCRLHKHKMGTDL